MSVETVYDPESECELAIGAQLTNAIATFTPSDAPQFQKERARVEVVCALGAGQGHMQDIDEDPSGDYRPREDAWAMQFRVMVVTQADIKSHRSVLALMRKTMAELPWTINGTATGMQNHFIGRPMVHQSSSRMFKTADGLFQTQMVYSGIISVHRDAWDKLNLTT